METYSLFSCNEELASIRIWPSICHAHGIGFVMFQVGELVCKFLAPDALSACAVAKWVTGLYHEFADYAMEDDVVVVVIAPMGDEILHSLGCGVWEEANGDVAIGSVECCRRTRCCECFIILLFVGASGTGFLVLYVTGRLGSAGIIGVHVEADLARTCRDQHGVSRLGFLKQWVLARCHFDRDDTLFLWLTLIETQP